FMAFLKTILGILAAQALASGATAAHGDAHVIQGVEQAQLAREEGVESYSVTERYTLRNSRFSEAAEMVVAVTYKKGSGKVYRVLSRKGPAFLQNTVFDRVLREEAAMSHGSEREDALVTPV